ncbi:MAG: ATP-dependent sacrificial sulfur transferase LarE [Verrucomicrobia bacterium]|nr:ATP-dependent sacrificial sulfur transferase LarE [Verrucomicrobiota bacterium]
MPLSTEMDAKHRHLKTLIQVWPSAFVAYSGGVDSAFLLWTAHQILGSKVTGILGDSPSLPRSEHSAALDFARQHQLPVEVISTQEMADPSYAVNPPNRCFFCRSELFKKMELLATQRAVPILAYGENADDALTVRAGRAAAGNFHVVAPLREAGLTKEDIRALAREAGLEIAEKPASPCLSSRLAPGLAVTPDRLASIEQAETAVRARGFRIVRVRHLGSKALLQVSPEETPRLLEPSLREDLSRELMAAGFAQVEFDPAGYQGAGLL